MQFHPFDRSDRWKIEILKIQADIFILVCELMCIGALT